MELYYHYILYHSVLSCSSSPSLFYSSILLDDLQRGLNQNPFSNLLSSFSVWYVFFHNYLYLRPFIRSIVFSNRDLLSLLQGINHRISEEKDIDDLSRSYPNLDGIVEDRHSIGQYELREVLL